MSGRLAYVTGGMGGIGTAICKRLCREGFRVVAGCGPGSPRKDRWVADMKAQGYEVHASEGNVADWESTRAAFEKVRNELGPVDVLVNNAGGVAHPSEFEKFDEEGRRWEIALNIDGVVNCCQAVASDMLGRASGSIVNISSNSSLLGEAAANIAHYGGVKGFVNSFSKALAWEWAAKGVRLRQTTNFPEQAGTRLQIDARAPTRFSLRLRHPAWCARLTVQLNGRPLMASTEPGRYVELDRTWTIYFVGPVPYRSRCRRPGRRIVVLFNAERLFWITGFQAEAGDSYVDRRPGFWAYHPR